MTNQTDCTDRAPDLHPSGHGLARLEADRHRMVQTVLQIRARYESADSSHDTEDAALMRKLLQAAVRDLENLDERLQRDRARR